MSISIIFLLLKSNIFIQNSRYISRRVGTCICILIPSADFPIERPKVKTKETSKFKIFLEDDNRKNGKEN